VAYLGNNPGNDVFVETLKDTFSGTDSATTFTLSVDAVTNAIEVFVENVQQEPTVSYTVAGTTLTFDSAPPAGTNNIYVIHRDPAVSRPLVTTANIADNSITNLKLANDSVSFAQVTLTSFNGVIQATGGGGMYFAADSDIYMTTRDFSGTKADFITGGPVKLYYNNSLKFETTDSGANVYNNLNVGGTAISALIDEGALLNALIFGG
jgi:hypothetical protein